MFKCAMGWYEQLKIMKITITYFKFEYTLFIVLLASAPEKEINSAN